MFGAPRERLSYRGWGWWKDADIDSYYREKVIRLELIVVQIKVGFEGMKSKVSLALHLPFKHRQIRNKTNQSNEKLWNQKQAVQKKQKIFSSSLDCFVDIFLLKMSTNKQLYLLNLSSDLSCVAYSTKDWKLLCHVGKGQTDKHTVQASCATLRQKAFV